MSELDYKESWTPKNWCFWTVVLEKTLESSSDCKEIKPVNPKGNHKIHWKDWCWSWSSSTLATWCEELTHWQRPWCWERLKTGREGVDRGSDGWLASPTWWTWVWASFGIWCWTRKPGVLQSMGSQRVRYNWMTELNWTWQTNMRASWPDPSQVSTSGKAGWRDPNWDSAQDWDRGKKVFP